MFTPLILFGQPFDCTTPHYWLEPSKSYKPLKIEKKVLEHTKHFSTHETENFMAFFLKGMVSEFEIFDTTLEDMIELGGNDLESFYSGMAEERAHHVSVFTKKSPKSIERWLKFNNAAYHLEYQTYILENNHRMDHTWIHKDLKAFVVRHQARLLPDVEPKKVLQIEVLVREILPEHQWAIFNKFVSMLSARRRHAPQLDCIPILLFIFDCLNRKLEVNHAVIALWQIAYLTVHDQLFALVLFHFQDVIQDKDMFPFLNRTMLQACFDYLVVEDDESGVTNHDNQLVFIPFRDYVLLDAIDHDVPYKAFTKVSRYVHRANADIHALQSTRLNTVIDDLDIHLKMLGFKQMPRPNLSVDVPLQAVFSLQGTFIGTVFKPFTEQLTQTKMLLDQDKVQLSQLNIKAMALAQKPLENIEQLNELANEKKALEEQNKLVEDQLRAQFEALYLNACKLIEAHNKAFEKKHDQSAEEIEVLHGLLADAQHQLQELQQDKKVLAEQLIKAQQITQKGPSVATDCLEHLVSILEAKNPIRVVIDELLKRRPWVKVSDKLLKSLDAVAGFSRPAELARQLERLTSKEFLGAVSTKGSVGSFDYFTKQALSFKESDTTMSSQVMRRQREFMFNGKKLMCEPHLKLGNNNTEQEQLRIHFAIEDGEIYIGYIGRHLPTGLM